MVKNSVFTTALIVAGGKGNRMGGDIPKQLLHIRNRSILTYVLNAFQNSAVIDAIVLVVEPSILPICKKFDFTASVFPKLKCCVSGGEKRMDSVWNGLINSPSSDYFLIHDGVRPLVSGKLIAQSLEIAVEYGAAIPIISPTDTVKKLAKDATIVETVPRDYLGLAQTPQAFKANILFDSYKIARNDGFQGTDDASVVEYADYKVKTFAGDTRNIKITYPHDITISSIYLEEIEKEK